MASDYLILRAEPPALRLRPPPAPISENSYTAGGAAEAMGEEGLSYGLFVSCRVKRETEERRDYRISSGSSRRFHRIQRRFWCLAPRVIHHLTNTGAASLQSRGRREHE